MNPEYLYRVIAPIQSVRLHDAGGVRGVIEEIPSGALLKLAGPSALSSRMVEVSCGENRHAIFGEDLQARARSESGPLPGANNWRGAVA